MAKPKAPGSPVWECPICIQQFVGGPRCTSHNPTPEQRQAHPERYRRERFANGDKELVGKNSAILHHTDE